MNCNKAGLAEKETVALSIRHFDLSQKEIEQTIRSAYRRHEDEFNTLKLTGSPIPGKENEEGSQPLSSLTSELSPTPDPSPEQDEETPPVMPDLPDDIFDSIPGFLKRVVCVVKTKEERDILLLGTLTTLSVALHQLTGKYRDIPVNPNLYLFVSAPASAGKGILIYCRKLVLPIHQRLREQSKILRQLYEAEMAEYRVNKNKAASLEPPQKPPRKMLIMPGDSSATGFSQILNDSNQRGLIFETEGDTLSRAFKSEHGNFSDGFRKAFQHEPISYYRRTDDEHVEIERPCLSVLLSGTAKQIHTLIPDTENGLFSRFMFYVMNMNYEWQDVFYSLSDKGINVHFEQLGKEFYEFYQVLELLPEISFTLTNGQQEKFNTYFQGVQNLYLTIQQEDIVSTVRRLGLIAFRIMMIFSALRLMESGEQTKGIVCEDVDFENTLKLISVLIQHSSHVFNQVAQAPHKVKPKNLKEQFLELLPDEFNRRIYLEIALKLKIKDHTAQRYIRKFVQAGVLLSPFYDQYKRVEMYNAQKK